MTSVAIVGAGVAGLTTAVVFRDAGVDVEIFASEIESTTSAAAPAIWFPHAVGPADKVERWARIAYEKFESLAGVGGVSMVTFNAFGDAMRVPLIETPLYLPWLRRGLRIHRRTIRDLSELEFDVVVNCAGLGARELCGDRGVRPGRGVVLKTANPGITRHMASVDGDALTYIITRTDDVVLGGTNDESESRDVPRALAEEIFARCAAVEPRLPREYVVDAGFRPLRDEVRLERQGNVIHNYGHGGAGFTVSWGCAAGVLELYRQVRS